MSPAEKRKELEAKQLKLAKIIEEAGESLDFEKVKSLDGETTDDKVKQFQALHDEVNDLGNEIIRDDLKERASQVKALGERVKGTVRGGGLIPLPDERGEIKSIGQQFVNSDQFKEFHKSRGEIKQFAVTLPDADIKALFSTVGGWAPESVRIPRVVEAVTRPIQILDLIPMAPTDQASVVYMEEATRTHSAAERNEGASYAEDTYELIERTSPVRSIGTSVPVTDEQLEDVGQVAAYVDNRLRFGVRQRLDLQVLRGDGLSPNLRGITAAIGIQTQAKGADPTFDAFHKAMTLVRVTGRAFPNAAIIHPTDWEEIRLTRTADGIYIMGNPADQGPMQLFGLPIVLSDAFAAAGTGLVGDFLNFCQLFEKRGIQIEVGYTGTQFAEGKRTIRASLRAAFVVYRPAAFCTVTGI